MLLFYFVSFYIIPVTDKLSKKISYSLCTQLSRVKKKRRQYHKAGAVEIHVSKWIHFDQLHFLKEYVIKKHSVSDLKVK